MWTAWMYDAVVIGCKLLMDRYTSSEGNHLRRVGLFLEQAFNFALKFH
jgi:hypothetical protein